MDLYSQLKQSKKRSRGDGSGWGGQSSSMIPTALRRKPQTAASTSSESSSTTTDSQKIMTIKINSAPFQGHTSVSSSSWSQSETASTVGSDGEATAEATATTVTTTTIEQTEEDNTNISKGEEDTSAFSGSKGMADQPAPDMSLHAFPTEEFDEYDPVNPNDYEEIVAERERRRQEERARLELQRQMQAKDMERQRLREQREQLEKTYGAGAAAGRGRGRGVDLRPEWLRKQQDREQTQQSASSASSETTAAMSGVHTDSVTTDESPQYGVSYGRGRGRGRDASSGAGENKPRGMELAAKMMHGWGYQEGKGLGKDESGITAPLEHEKVGHAHGIIKNPDEEQADYSENDTKPMNASRIVLLQNMVGRGEVDKDLQSETAEECSNFGPVIQCVVDESKDSSTRESDAVRIFVEFENEPTAVRGMTIIMRECLIFDHCCMLLCSSFAAVKGLHGRMFGGRKVLASFYPEHLFESRQLR
eukprot:gb/GECG01000556.1/.p1 GENE.gb/GECG01000556.1/~~gb/GECG01000556.1/.p1  ORF type:complete len:477 (+),score=83.25 gb/GECG01000556.1/:1-1431(+)